MDLQKRKQELINDLNQARQQSVFWMNKIQQMTGAIAILEEQLQGGNKEVPKSPKTEEKPAK